MTDRVLTCLPDGRWLALSRETFEAALAEGAKVIAPPVATATEAEALLDAEQLAAALSLPVTWVEQAAREGRIPNMRAGRWRRFNRAAVEAVLAKGSAR
jgi:excisionase family DNA binding protein